MPTADRVKLTSRSSRGYYGTVKAGLSDEVNFDSGIATGVVDLTGVDLADGHVDCEIVISLGYQTGALHNGEMWVTKR